MGIKATLTIHGNGCVNVLMNHEGVLNEKVLPFSTLFNILLQMEHEHSKKQQCWETTPLLPPNTLLYGVEHKSNQEALSFIWGPEILTSTYHDTLFPAIPFPVLVVYVQLHREEERGNRRIKQVCVAAIKGEPTLDSQLYRYPFPNVYPGGRVCTGTVGLPIIQQLVELPTAMRLLFSAPSSDDLYTPGQTNLSGLCCRELFQEVNGKPEFPKEYLAPLGRPAQGITLAEWYRGFGLLLKEVA